MNVTQYDPEVCPEKLYHGHPQVILAYLKYQWSVGDDFKRKEAFVRLQVCNEHICFLHIFTFSFDLIC